MGFDITKDTAKGSGAPRPNPQLAVVLRLRVRLAGSPDKAAAAEVKWAECTRCHGTRCIKYCSLNRKRTSTGTRTSAGVNCIVACIEEDETLEVLRQEMDEDSPWLLRCGTQESLRRSATI